MNYPSLREVSELSESTGAPVEIPALVMDSEDCPSSYTAVFSDSTPPYLSCILLCIFTITQTKVPNLALNKIKVPNLALNLK